MEEDEEVADAAAHHCDAGVAAEHEEIVPSPCALFSAYINQSPELPQ